MFDYVHYIVIFIFSFYYHVFYFIFYYHVYYFIILSLDCYFHYAHFSFCFLRNTFGYSGWQAFLQPGKQPLPSNWHSLFRENRQVQLSFRTKKHLKFSKEFLVVLDLWRRIKTFAAAAFLTRDPVFWSPRSFFPRLSSSSASRRAGAGLGSRPEGSKTRA